MLHVNHARELSAAARAACARIVDAGIPMLSQTVLLRGVNDDADTLEELLRRSSSAASSRTTCITAILRPAPAHLRTSIAEGQDLMRALARAALRHRAADLCARYSGWRGKSAGRAELSSRRAGGYQVEDPRGKRHIYPPPAKA